MMIIIIIIIIPIIKKDFQCGPKYNEIFLLFYFDVFNVVDSPCGPTLHQ